MIVVQTICTVLNILLITNILDRGYVPIMIILIAFWHVGLQFALAGTTFTLEQKQNFTNSGIASTVFMFIFLYIAKRIHKEVFIEHKRSSMLQTEYRTIYDQLEESIFVLKEDRITHLNLQFKKFVIKFFGPEML